MLIHTHTQTYTVAFATILRKNEYWITGPSKIFSWRKNVQFSEVISLFILFTKYIFMGKRIKKIL